MKVNNKGIDIGLNLYFVYQMFTVKIIYKKQIFKSKKYSQVKIRNKKMKTVAKKWRDIKFPS